MDRMLYIGMSGAKETMLAHGMNSHNLANANTTGFRQDLAQFRSMPVFGPGHPSRAYSMSERPGFNFSAGPLQSTNNPLDVAIQDEGWFVVESLDGSQALTRAGNFRVTPEGFLVTGSGLRVVGNGGPITIPPAERISIGNDGTITIKPAGQGAAALAVIDRLQLVNPDNASLDKGRDGLFRLKNDEAFLQDANVKVLSGMLESSNVNVIEAMVNVISLSRNYEMQAKVMATAKETDEASMKLMALG